MTALSDAVAAWKPVDYSGSGDLLDASGNGHDATPQNSPTFTDPYFDMNGSSHHFTVLDHADLDFAEGDDFSVVFVGYNTANPSADEWGLAKKAGFGTDIGYALQLNAGGSGRFNIGDNSAQGLTTFPAADALPHNTIFDLAGIRDTTPDDEVSWMHDGTEFNATADDTTTTIANALNLFLCADANDTDHFTGRFYGAAIFAVVLTAAEVTSIKNEIITAAAGQPGGIIIQNAA